MTLASGDRLGSYEVQGPLGAGGMGEVYRATDARLKRDVALKVLPAAFVADRERLARFEREAQLLAQLQHPNIASIYGIEEAEGVRALVMELVPGPTLAERMAAAALPLEETLAIARQIAEALEAAHEKGIVHRDLKPQNVKVTADGTVKVLDFGLAKAMEEPGSTAAADVARSPTIMNSPTLTAVHGTQLGVILGTAAYMAPEQAAGAAVDRRADIWAFGVVLYEMLAGRRLFEGETVSHVLAGVLKDEPDFGALPAGTPRRIEELVRRCLRKKARQRLQAIGDARVVIDEVLADPEAEAREARSATAAGTPSASRARLAWAIAGVAAAAAAAFALLWLRGPGAAPAARPVHAALVAPPGGLFGDTLALSPDGRRLVFNAFDRDTRTGALWLRDLGRGEATRIPATEGGEMAFWSPDGQEIGFFADGKLKRIDLRGGLPQTICDAPTPRGGTWGPDGRIVFTPSFRVGLSIVRPGSPPEELTRLDEARGEKSHRFPRFLPGGKRILFLAQTAEAGARADESTIEVLDLGSRERHRLTVANSSSHFSPVPAPGVLLYWREGSLLAHRFDPDRLALSGEARPVASPVAFSQNEEALASVSEQGTLVFRAGERGAFSSIVSLDREGIGRKVLLDQGLFDDFRLSHDGKRLAYATNSSGKGDSDIWVYDMARGASSRITFEEGSDDRPVWSPDDRYLYYMNDRENDGTIFRRESDGMGNAVRVGETPEGFWPLDVSPDGRFLVVGAVTSGTGFDLQKLDLESGKVTPLVATPFQDDYAALSPDGRLLAYASEQSGRWEIYVQALAGGTGATGRWQISTEGGVQPHWRADGRELYFLSPPDRLLAVDVVPGESPRFAAPRELFRQAIDRFDAAPDGQSFVALRPSDSDKGRPLSLILNWPAALDGR
ncbi:MAG: protein kinase [Thermoanaerobaculia bacterium]